MAFKFKDLSITLSTSFENGEPRAVLAVVGCGPQSVVMHLGTCAVQTQSPCTTNPDDVKLEDVYSGIQPRELRDLQEALQGMLGHFGPAAALIEEGGEPTTQRVARNR